MKCLDDPGASSEIIQQALPRRKTAPGAETNVAFAGAGTHTIAPVELVPLFETT